MDQVRQDEFRARRARAMELLGDDALILFAATTRLRNNDVEFDFRQDSDFFYLTGFEEPDAVLLLKQGQFVLFVRPRNRERETWEGRRAGVEGAVGTFGADEAHSVEELTERLADALENVKRLHTTFGTETLVEPRLGQVFSTLRSRRRRRVEPPRELVDAARLVHEMRLRKSPGEIQAMRRAAEATARGHLQAMRICRPGLNEFELQNALEMEFRAGGSRRLAYSSIVGGGDNGTILHYRENDQPLRDGDLVLIDAGAEYDYYACDVTRTFPVNGRFSPIQRRAYELVLRAQLAAIAATTKGHTLDIVHDAALGVLADGFVELGLISADSTDRKRDAGKYYMHRTSHYLGMDVHDVGSYYRDGKPLELEPGMVITVEPGLYVPADDDTAPLELRGMGIRIEDDVLVTQGAPEVLTAATPKTVEEIERACQGVLAPAAE